MSGLIFKWSFGMHKIVAILIIQSVVLQAGGGSLPATASTATSEIGHPFDRRNAKINVLVELFGLQKKESLKYLATKKVASHVESLVDQNKIAQALEYLASRNVPDDISKSIALMHHYLKNPYPQEQVIALSTSLPERAVHHVCHKNNRIFASATSGLLWCAHSEDPKNVVMLQAHADAIRSMCFVGDNLITASHDKTLKVWPKRLLEIPKTVEPQIVVDCPSSVKVVAAIPGRLQCVTVSDNILRLWDLEGVDQAQPGIKCIKEFSYERIASIHCVQIDTEGKIYLLDFTSSKIHVINPDFTYNSAIPCPSKRGPIDFAVTDKKIVVKLFDLNIAIIDRDTLNCIELKNSGNFSSLICSSSALVCSEDCLRFDRVWAVEMLQINSLSTGEFIGKLQPHRPSETATVSSIRSYNTNIINAIELDDKALIICSTLSGKNQITILKEPQVPCMVMQLCLQALSKKEMTLAEFNELKDLFNRYKQHLTEQEQETLNRALFDREYQLDGLLLGGLKRIWRSMNNALA